MLEQVHRVTQHLKFCENYGSQWNTVTFTVTDTTLIWIGIEGCPFLILPVNAIGTSIYVDVFGRLSFCHSFSCIILTSIFNSDTWRRRFAPVVDLGPWLFQLAPAKRHCRRDFFKRLASVLLSVLTIWIFKQRIRVERVLRFYDVCRTKIRQAFEP